MLNKGRLVLIVIASPDAIGAWQSGVDEGITHPLPDRRVIPMKSGFLAMTRRMIILEYPRINPCMQDSCW